MECRASVSPDPYCCIYSTFMLKRASSFDVVERTGLSQSGDSMVTTRIVIALLCTPHFFIEFFFLSGMTVISMHSALRTLLLTQRSLKEAMVAPDTYVITLRLPKGARAALYT